MKKKWGWTAAGMVGMIFTPIGLLFSIIGLGLWQAKSVTWQKPEDPVIFFSVFGGIGGIFLLLGLILLGLDLRRRSRLRNAYYSGNCVEAKILGMVTQNNVNTFSGVPRMLECAWTDASGVVHVYRSRYLYTDVSQMLKSDTVPVYIDRENEKYGFVDVDAVLPEIRIH